MMVGDGMRSIVDIARSETMIHVQYMRKSILMNLLFTFFIIVVDIVNVAVSISTRKLGEALFLSPPPILFIALAISIAVQFRMLRRIGGSISGLKKCGSGALGGDSTHAEKSVTNVNYEIVAAMYRSLKIWPVIALLLVLYFIGSIFNIAEWLIEVPSDASLDDSTALNGITLFFAFIFFWIQTTRWLTRRRKLKELESMEMAMMNELHI